jgi:plasmid segregation protein ParM
MSKVNTADFCTKHEYIPRKNGDPAGISPVALDIGYSSVKGLSKNACFMFPSYMKSTDTGKLMGDPAKEDVFYADKDGEQAVGAFAASGVREDDSEESENTLYGRGRYGSKLFLVLARVGMAYGLSGNRHGEHAGEGRTLLWTGLPPAFRKADTPLLLDALSGRHEFAVKLGEGPYTEFGFNLARNDISVLDQPMGSLFSASLAPDLSRVYLPDGRKIVDAETVVLDAGFGTIDVYFVSGREVKSFETWRELGMRAVFARLSEALFDAFGTDVPVHAMQRMLAKGQITVFDRRNRETRDIPVAGALARANAEICGKALDKLDGAYDSLRYADVLLVTGGTGEAWYPIIRERYRGMKNLRVMRASENDVLPLVYGNARGYWLHGLLSAGRSES